MRNTILLVLLAVHTVFSDECKPLPAMSELDITKTDGWWYLHYYTKDEEAGDGMDHARCLTMYFEHKPDGRLFVLEAFLPKESERKNEGVSYMGMGQRNTTDGVIWFEQWHKGVLETIPTHVVDTDYSNYVILSFCYLDELMTWVVTNTPEDKVADNTVKAITQSLEATKTPMDHFSKLTRKECPY